MKHKLIVLAIAAALPLSALAQTGSPASPGKSPSKTPLNTAATSSSAPGSATGAASPLDTNKDGYVSRAEAKASPAISARFSELDKDGDGKLSAQELSSASSASSGGGQRPGSEPKTKY